MDDGYYHSYTAMHGCTISPTAAATRVSVKLPTEEPVTCSKGQVPHECTSRCEDRARYSRLLVVGMHAVRQARVQSAYPLDLPASFSVVAGGWSEVRSWEHKLERRALVALV